MCFGMCRRDYTILCMFCMVIKHNTQWPSRPQELCPSHWTVRPCYDVKKTPTHLAYSIELHALCMEYACSLLRSLCYVMIFARSTGIHTVVCVSKKTNRQRKAIQKAKCHTILYHKCLLNIRNTLETRKKPDQWRLLVNYYSTACSALPPSKSRTFKQHNVQRLVVGCCVWRVYICWI